MMIRYRRPAKPRNFDDDVSASAEAVRSEFTKPTPPPGPVDFPDDWGRFKDRFFAAQFGKCGYCESHVRAVTNGDVEHHFPKAEVQRLLDDGEELANLSNVRGRKGERTSHGYWWRAYEWTNYLLACGNCNSKWKRNFFPVVQDPEDGPRPAFPADTENDDKPLVLHPFGRHLPEVHLEFHSDGSVTGRTREGRATIRVCGLDRPSLREARLERAKRVSELVDALLTALEEQNSAASTEALFSLHKVGAARWGYVGVTRSIVRHRANMNWKDVDAFVISEFVDRFVESSGAARDTVLTELAEHRENFDDPRELERAIELEAGQSFDRLIAGF